MAQRTPSTPFRDHFEYCRGLDITQQLEEVADYIHHPGVLITEFLESYYLVERFWDAEASLDAAPDTSQELLLEPFHRSLELWTERPSGNSETLRLVSGALSPLPGPQHPALSRTGLDYVGFAEGPPPRLTLGVAQASKEETPYLLLMRALNCFAELAPPFQVVQLSRQVVGQSIPEGAHFDLQVCTSDDDPSHEAVALGELCRDLAEVFKRRIGERAQFADTLGAIELVEPERDGDANALRSLWRV